jgi:cytochrome d ubiquinol oxidase subunit I
VTGEQRYHDLARFWTKIFAISFAMGVVSGIALSYQFGTNWSGFSEVVGNVVGPLIGYEVLSAFFLEATFLGVLLFGWNRFPRKLHFASAVVVALGTAMSAFWILSANSWMQYPTGHAIENGVAVPDDWMEIIFSPTFPVRFAHMLLAAYITTAFVVLAVGARYAFAGRHREEARIMLRGGLGLLLVLVPAQLLVGDQAGEKVRDYQPAKLAAIEAHWKSEESPVPFVLFAWPNEAQERNDFAITIPYASSLVVTRSLDGKFTGLDAFAQEDRPPVPPVFFAFRVMVGIGLLMLLTVTVGGLLWWRGRLMQNRLWLGLVRFAWPLGFVATLAGWYTTEIGRQPWVVTGVLRTEDAVSPVAGTAVATSLALFVVVYAIVFSAGTLYIARVIRRGPQSHAAQTGVEAGRRPIVAAGGAVPQAGE